MSRLNITINDNANKGAGQALNPMSIGQYEALADDMVRSGRCRILGKNGTGALRDTPAATSGPHRAPADTAAVGQHLSDMFGAQLRDGLAQGLSHSDASNKARKACDTERSRLKSFG